MIIEVAHPIISKNCGEKFLEHCDYVVYILKQQQTIFVKFILFFQSKIGSPTALADEQLLKRLEQTAIKFSRRIYVPCGAFWGASKTF